MNLCETASTLARCGVVGWWLWLKNTLNIQPQGGMAQSSDAKTLGMRCFSAAWSIAISPRACTRALAATYLDLQRLVTGGRLFIYHRGNQRYVYVPSFIVTVMSQRLKPESKHATACINSACNFIMSMNLLGCVSLFKIMAQRLLQITPCFPKTKERTGYRRRSMQSCRPSTVIRIRKSFDL